MQQHAVSTTAAVGDLSELSIQLTALNSLKSNEIIWTHSPSVTHYDKETRPHYQWSFIHICYML